MEAQEELSAVAWFKNNFGVCSVAGLVVAPCSRAVLEAVKKIADEPKYLTGTSLGRRKTIQQQLKIT